MPVRRITEDDLPGSVMESLEKFRTADEECRAAINVLKESDPEGFTSVENLIAHRNLALHTAAEDLKRFFKGQAQDDASVATSNIDEFKLTPRRSKGWDVEKFLDAASDLDVFDQLVEDGGIIILQDAHLNIDRARELDVLEDLVAKGIVTITLSHQIDGKVAEDNLRGRVFAEIKERAWEEELSNVACTAPPKIEPL